MTMKFFLPAYIHRTAPRSLRLSLAFSWVFVFVNCALAPLVLASPSPTSLKKLDIDSISSLDTLDNALDTLRESSSKALERTEPAYAVQSLILTKAGQCVSKIYSLDPSPSRSAGENGRASRLFAKNRDLIKRILAFNEATIQDYQEHRLDELADPTAFFTSPAWQQPQQIITLASYWLGWNGYYASLHLPKDAPLRRELLQEAIDGFSRAFIDFKEDAVTTKSLFGRGLCYKELGIYGRAAHDFKSIRDKLPNGDPLTIRCRYEEAVISFDTGNIERAQRELNQTRQEYSQAQIPEDVSLRMNRLEANILLARVGKEQQKTKGNAAARNTLLKTTFHELKQFAASKDGAETALYKFVKTHADVFKAMDYSGLGPVGTLAIADWYFDQKRYDNATPYYLDLYGERPAAVSKRMDSISFRLAVLFSKKKHWTKAIEALKGFPTQFPSSSISSDASALFYLAAGANYRDHASDRAYGTYLAAIRRYLNLCADCPERGEAHFELGSYYQKRSMVDEAISEFKKVEQTSPRYAAASYQLIFLEARSQQFASSNACEKTLRRLNRFEHRYPKAFDLHGEATSLRVVCNHKLGRFDEAKRQIDQFSGSAAKNAKQYAALQKLGDRFYRMSHDADQSAESTPDAASVVIALRIYEKLLVISRQKSRFAEFSNPIELRIAQLYAARNQTDAAIATYQSLLDRDPQSADAVFGLGLVYAQTGQWQSALETWRRFSDAVKAGTHHWFVSRYQTANALEHLGKTKRACAVAKMTLVLHPDVGDENLNQDFLQIQSRNCAEERRP